MKKTLITATMSATGSAVMELMDGIGKYEYTLKQWSAAYAGVATASAITLRINSGGGDIVEALAIADAIRNAPQQFTAEVYGICGSAATLIALACDRIVMAPSARWMVHEPAFGVRGSIQELRAFLATAEQLRTDIYALYSQHTGKTPEQLMADHAADRYYTAAEALAYGWVSAIMGAPEVKPEETPEPPAPEEPAEEQPAEEMEEDTEPTEEETPETPAPEQPTEDAPADEEDPDAPEEPEKPRTTAVTRLLALLGMRSAAQKQFDALSYWQHRARKAEAVAAGHIAHAARRRRDVEAEHAAHLQRVNAEVAARMAALGFSASALPAPVQAPTPPAAPSLASLAKADGFDAALAAAAARLR